jgi:hypothetical protein
MLIFVTWTAAPIQLIAIATMPLAPLLSIVAVR